jgi:hypothetical protein
MCRFAHSEIEKDTWNIKKRMLMENDDLRPLQNIIGANIPCHSPSEVCTLCCEKYNNAIWLAWLLCVHPEEHTCSERCNTVVANASVVRVRELPSRIRRRTNPNTPKLCPSVQNNQGYCPQGDTCSFAHSQGEVNYWKWCLANAIFEGLVGYNNTPGKLTISYSKKKGRRVVGSHSNKGKLMEVYNS